MHCSGSKQSSVVLGLDSVTFFSDTALFYRTIMHYAEQNINEWKWNVGIYTAANIESIPDRKYQSNKNILSVKQF